MEKIIIDGDWGGDEMQLAAVLLAHPHRFDLAGATAVFGNTTLDQVVENAGRILTFLGATNVPLYAGASGPTDGLTPEGDDAHGADGLGGTPLPSSEIYQQPDHAVDFILDTLAREDEKRVTITATGPLTNIAQAFSRAPETMWRVKNILVMGGCTQAMKAMDRPERLGNITPFAEFNFYMAAEDAHIVLESGLPIVLFPMNCTHQMTFTPERRDVLRSVLKDFPAETEVLTALIDAPHKIDRMKFDSCSVMHDVHTALYAIAPATYEGRRGNVRVTSFAGDRKGHSIFTENAAGPHLSMERVIDPHAQFTRVAEALRFCLEKR